MQNRISGADRQGLPRGIVSALQTPFTSGGELDRESLCRLVRHAAEGGASGVVAPVVASEVDYLSVQERSEVIVTVAGSIPNDVQFIVGASSPDVGQCRHFARLAEEHGAAACLVAVPDSLYGEEELILEFFEAASSGISLPLIIQDLRWHGRGLRVETLQRLRQRIPCLAGFKIETLPAGPQYTAVRRALGQDVYVCGGWAVTQLIEALDRGVDAMIPESSLVKTYASICRAHASGRRDQALRWFRKLLPVLAFTNQEIAISIAFFKRLLVRKGIFRHPRMRHPDFAWDEYNVRIADELIEYYLALEADWPPKPIP